MAHKHGLNDQDPNWNLDLYHDDNGAIVGVGFRAGLHAPMKDPEAAVRRFAATFTWWLINGPTVQELLEQAAQRDQESGNSEVPQEAD